MQSSSAEAMEHRSACIPLLGADRSRFLVADKRLWKGIGLRYLVLSCQLVCVGIVGNKRIRFSHDRFIPCIEGGGLFSCVIIDNRFLLVSWKFHNPLPAFPIAYISLIDMIDFGCCQRFFACQLSGILIVWCYMWVFLHLTEYSFTSYGNIPQILFQNRKNP